MKSKSRCVGYQIDLDPHTQYAIRDVLKAHPDVIIGSTTCNFVWWNVSPPGPRARSLKKRIEQMIAEGLREEVYAPVKRPVYRSKKSWTGL